MFSHMKKLKDASTIKTLDIIKMLGDVNDLNSKQEILQNSKLSNLAQSETPIIDQDAFEAIHEMLREEGVEYDIDQEIYYVRETGEVIDIDIHKIIQDYLETL